ncbi:DUF1697 domain-containing protein [soil metagenome]
MTRYIAFLRAINVGGRTVKMDRLREVFEQLGLSNVETFIASGNVIFEFPAGDTPALERQIETLLQESLGYRVDTFVRSAAELAAIAAYEPFPASTLDAGDTTLYVSFLSDPPPQTARDNIFALQIPTDEFHIHERELYWLRHGKISDSTISGALLEKAVGMPATMRNANTIKRIIAKYPVS